MLAKAQDTPVPVAPIAPATVRYIKLGRRGCWEDISFTQNQFHFGRGEGDDLHELARRGDRAGMIAALLARGQRPATAADNARQILDFYQLGADGLWITFANGRLWWAFAEPHVTLLGDGNDQHGDAMRRIIGRWRDTDILGRPLLTDVLSSRLTQLAAYRATICSVGEAAYCLRRINGIAEPVVAEAEAAREALVKVAGKLIAGLHWRDFELMVDLIFARSGWQRISEVGGDQKDTDMRLVLPTTGERAFVQIKSKADQAVLDQSVARFRASGAFDRMFFICHSPQKSLVAPPAAAIHVWAGPLIASAAVGAGLFDWLVDRAR